MAKNFNLTAELNLRGPANLKTVIADIKRQLGTIDGNINVKIDPGASKNIQGITRRVEAMTNAIVIARRNTDDLNASLKGLSVSLGSIRSSGGASTSTLKTTADSIKQVSQSTTEASSRMEEFGKQSALAIKRFAAFSFVTTGVFALVNAINSGTKAFIEFDREIVRLQQVTGKSRAGLSDLSNEITRLATTLGVSSASLIEVASTLAQAGFSASDTKVALEALAKTELAPSFENLTKTTEGAIAALRQFGLQTSQLESALGSINAVAAAFAVESSDIIAAIQRTGGVFAAASRGVSEGTDALNEFVAVFTSVRATTRESAETIATGLRTIFTRIQRAGTIEQLKAFGVELTDIEGKFVGPFEAVKRLSAALNQLDPRDIRFSSIVEELGGFRQIGKVIPLIQQYATAQEALKVAQRGQDSLTAAQVTAQQSLANQIAKVREQFLALVRDIGQSSAFQNLFKVVTGLASGLIGLVGAFKPILPLLSLLAVIKGVGAVTKFGSGFAKQFGGSRGAKIFGRQSTSGVAAEKEKADVTAKASEIIRLNTDAIKTLTASIQSLDSTIKSRGTTGLNDGGKVMAFARGGVVPGSGNRDTVPAMLMPGEFVIRKKAVETLGAGNLQRMNKYAVGGYVKKQLPKAEEKLKQQAIAYDDISNLKINTSGKGAIRGYMFENYVGQAYGVDAPDQQFPDIPNLSLRLKKQFGLTKEETGKDIKAAELKYRSGLEPNFNEEYTPDNTAVVYAIERNLGGIIPKFAVGGKALGARSRMKELSQEEILQLSTPDLIAYAKALAADVFSTSGAGMAVANEFIEVPQERIVPELEADLVTYLGKKGFWREKVAPFGKASAVLAKNATKVDKQSALEAQISKQADEVAARSQQWTSIRSGSTIDNYLLSSLKDPVLTDYKTARSGGSLAKTFHNTRLRKAVNEALDNYDDFDYSAANIDKLVSGMAAERFAYGGLVQRFANGTEVESVGKISDSILRRLEEVGSPGSIREALGVNFINNIIREKLAGRRITSKELLSPRSLKSIPDSASLLPALEPILEEAEKQKRAKETEKQNQIARNLQASAGGAYRFGLASIFGPNGEFGYSNISNAKEIEGKDGEKYLTQIIQKSLPQRYAGVIEQIKNDLMLAPQRAAENLQYTDIFGTSGPLAFDFDETLVDKADIPGKKFEDYSNLDKVKEALGNAELTLLGRELQKRISQYPQLLDSIRVLTARPQSNAPYLASTLARLNLPIPANKITGVAGGLNKVKNMSDLETLIDDNLENVESVLGAGKRAIRYQQAKPINLSDPSSAKSISVMEGYALEEMVKSLGVPISADDADPNRPIDFPKGLGANARFWDLPSTIPTDTKRSNTGSAVGRLFKEAQRFFIQNFKLGGKVYDLQQGTGLSNNEFDQLVNYANTNGFNDQEFKEYLSNYVKNKASKKDLRLNSEQLRQVLLSGTTTQSPSSKQMDLARSLMGEPDAKYNPKYDSARKGFAQGGSAQDTVPALLTPGEFVINKKAAQKIGYGQLHKLNKADKLQGYNKGGIVDGVQRFVVGGVAEKQVARAQGTVLTDIKQAEKTFATIMGSLGKEVRDQILSSFKGIEKIGAGGKTSLGSPFTDTTRGQAVFGTQAGKEVSLMGLQIGGKKAKATTETVAHETGHLADYSLGGGEKFASDTSGTFQFELIEKVKPIMIKAFEQAGRSSKEIARYLATNKELFAEFFAKASPEVRAIITSTTDAKIGMEKLAANLGDTGYTFAGLERSDIVDGEDFELGGPILAPPRAGEEKPEDFSEYSNFFGSKPSTGAPASGDPSGPQRGRGGLGYSAAALKKNINSAAQSIYNLFISKIGSGSGSPPLGGGAGSPPSGGGGGVPPSGSGGGVPPSGGGPDPLKDGLNAAAEQAQFFAFKAKQAGLTTEQYQRKLAKETAQLAKDLKADLRSRQQDLKFTSINLGAGLKGRSRTGTDSDKTLIRQAEEILIEKIKAINPAAALKDIEDASSKLVDKLIESGGSFEEVKDSVDLVRDSMNKSPESIDAVGEAMRAMAEQTGISVEILQNQIEAQVEAQQTTMGAFKANAAEVVDTLGGPIRLIGIGMTIVGDQITKLVTSLDNNTKQNAGLMSVLGGITGGAQGMVAGQALGAEGGKILEKIFPNVEGLGRRFEFAATAVGTFIGVINGASDAYNRAQLDTVLNRIAESGKQVDIAFENLSKNNTVEAFNQAQKALVDSAGDMMSLADQANFGAGGGSRNTLEWMRGLDFTGITSSTSGQATEAEARDQLITGLADQVNRARQLGEVRMSRVSGAEVSANVQKVQNIDKQIEERRAAGDTGDVKNLEAQRTQLLSTTSQVFGQLRQIYKSDSDAFLALYTEQAKRSGMTSEQISANLGDEDKRKAAIAEGARLSAMYAEQEQRSRVLADASRNVVIQTENIINIYKILDASLTRFGQTIETISNAASSAAAAYEGQASIQNVQPTDANIFENIAAYSLDEVKAAASRTAGLAGGGKTGTDLERRIVGAKTIQQELPKILSGVTAQNADDAIKQLRDQFEKFDIEVDPAVFNQLAETLQSRLTGQREGATTAELAEDPALLESLSKISETTLATATNLNKAYTDAVNGIIDNSNKYAQALEKATDLQLKAADIRANSEIQLSQTLGESLSLNELNAPADTRIRTLTNSSVRPGGSLDPSQISQDLQALVGQREQSAKKIADAEAKRMAATTDAGKAEAEKIAKAERERQAKLNVQINNTQKALEELANDSSRASNALQKLQDYRATTKAGVNLTQEILTADPDKLRDINKQLVAYNKTITGQATQKEMGNVQFRQQAFGGLDMLRSVMPEKIAQQMQARMSRQMLTSMGVDLNQTIAMGPDNQSITLDQALTNVETGKDPQQEAYIEAYRQATERQAAAADELANSAVKVATIYADASTKISDTLAKLPEKLEAAIKSATLEPPPPDKPGAVPSEPLVPKPADNRDQISLIDTMASQNKENAGMIATAITAQAGAIAVGVGSYMAAPILTKIIKDALGGILNKFIGGSVATTVAGDIGAGGTAARGAGVGAAGAAKAVGAAYGAYVLIDSIVSIGEYFADSNKKMEEIANRADAQAGKGYVDQVIQNLTEPGDSIIQLFSEIGQIGSYAAKEIGKQIGLVKNELADVDAKIKQMNAEKFGEGGENYKKLNAQGQTAAKQEATVRMNLARAEKIKAGGGSLEELKASMDPKQAAQVRDKTIDEYIDREKGRVAQYDMDAGGKTQVYNKAVTELLGRMEEDNAKMGKMAAEATTPGSIYTHDVKLEKLMSKLVDRPDSTSTSSRSDAFEELRNANKAFIEARSKIEGVGTDAQMGTPEDLDAFKAAEERLNKAKDAARKQTTPIQTPQQAIATATSLKAEGNLDEALKVLREEARNIKTSEGEYSADLIPINELAGEILTQKGDAESLAKFDKLKVKTQDIKDRISQSPTNTAATNDTISRSKDSVIPPEIKQLRARGASPAVKPQVQAPSPQFTKKQQGRLTTLSSIGKLRVSDQGLPIGRTTEQEAEYQNLRQMQQQSAAQKPKTPYEQMQASKRQAYLARFRPEVRERMMGKNKTTATPMPAPPLSQQNAVYTSSTPAVPVPESAPVPVTKPVTTQPQTTNQPVAPTQPSQQGYALTIDEKANQFLEQLNTSFNSFGTYITNLENVASKIPQQIDLVLVAEPVEVNVKLSGAAVLEELKKAPDAIKDLVDSQITNEINKKIDSIQKWVKSVSGKDLQPGQ